MRPPIMTTTELLIIDRKCIMITATATYDAAAYHDDVRQLAPQRLVHPRSKRTANPPERAGPCKKNALFSFLSAFPMFVPSLSW